MAARRKYTPYPQSNDDLTAKQERFIRRHQRRSQIHDGIVSIDPQILILYEAIEKELTKLERHFEIEHTIDDVKSFLGL